jgi:hypothetical protein
VLGKRSKNQMDAVHELPSGTPAGSICRKSSSSAIERELPLMDCADEIVAPLASVPGKELLIRFVAELVLSSNV